MLLLHSSLSKYVIIQCLIHLEILTKNDVTSCIITGQLLMRGKRKYISRFCIVPRLIILPITMAEQDRYASHWNSHPSNPVKDVGSSTSFGAIFRGSGAEQDRHDSHFGLGSDNPVKNAASQLDAFKIGSGAEQDRHASHFDLGENNPIRNAASRFNSSKFGTGTSGAEQDRYGSHFSVWHTSNIQTCTEQCRI